MAAGYPFRRTTSYPFGLAPSTSLRLAPSSSRTIAAARKSSKNAPMRTTSSGPRSFVSFTGARSPRYPAPDVARGFMLLLIALANVSFWLMLWEEQPEPTALGRASRSF